MIILNDLHVCMILRLYAFDLMRLLIGFVLFVIHLIVYGKDAFYVLDD